MKLQFRLYLFLLFLFTISCRHERIAHKLYVAENIIETLPDSTLHILNVMDFLQLNDESKALYGLLYTASLYKCSQPVANDTFIDRSIHYYQKNGDKMRLANAYYYKGAVNYTRKEYVKSVNYLKLAEEISEQLNDELLRNKIYERLAYANFVTEHGSQSLKYSKRFLDSSLKLRDAELISRGFACVSSSYYLLNHIDSATIYINMCMPQIINLDSSLQAHIFANIAFLAYENGNIEQAEIYVKKALKIKNNYYAYYISGLLEYDKGNKEEAKVFWKKALNTDDEKLKGIVYENLSKFYANDNNYEEAYRNNIQELEHIKKRYGGNDVNDLLEFQLEFDAGLSEKKLYENIVYLMGIILFAYIFISAYMFYHKKKVRGYEYKIESYANRISLYENDKDIYENKLIHYRKELKANIEKIKDLIYQDKLQQKEISQLTNKIGTLPQAIMRDLKKGYCVYDDIKNGKSIVRYSDADISKMIDFYSILEEKTFLTWQDMYFPLTIRQYLFLILEDFGYSDNDIANILGVAETTVRSTRSRIKKKKR